MVYFAYESTYSNEPKLTIIDWDVTQIKASLLPEYIPGVYDNLERLAKLCRPRLGSQGIFMEDAAMGQSSTRRRKPKAGHMTPIKSALTSKGKDETAVMASSYHYQGMCKISSGGLRQDRFIQAHHRKSPHKTNRRIPPGG